ncbi:ARF GAP with effector function(s) [Lodderomyces elongisporus]|uniref:ARF GAP with effector function(s) n=1 Tax=Lodderomyces elongisporus TaxID=36914 RepID=UPI0029233F04|nr:ARF GAP with effector function(s) [Lodderomyces elongisporus]WLF79576.1 ARF GAP with effector function(s) [Lodderomyces elongisporus]
MSYASRSSSRALPSSKKTHSETHKQILKQLLREEANKSCADCKTTKNPRWASWNLGCFICIRCSGIHRSMGTHISKVKSVDLDAWTDEQIENMVKWGNEKCNGYWESKLPEAYIPDGSKIENFIRTKYDLKKWCSSPTVPNPSTIPGKSQTVNNQNKSTNSSTNSSTSSSTNFNNNSSTASNASRVDSSSTKKTLGSLPTANSSAKSNSLLDDDFGHFTTSSKHTSSHAPPVPQKHSSQPVTPRTPQVPISRTPQPAQVSRTSQQLQSAQSTGGSISSNSRPDLKKSILSLYASPSSSNSFLQTQQTPPPQSQSQPLHLQQQIRANSQTNSLTDSLAGLSFHSNSTSNLYPGLNNTTTTTTTTNSSNYNNNNNLNNYSQPQSHSTGSLNAPSKLQQNIQNNTWNNEWSDASSTSSNATRAAQRSTTTNLDDDLFKNVWS